MLEGDLIKSKIAFLKTIENTQTGKTSRSKLNVFLLSLNVVDIVSNVSFSRKMSLAAFEWSLRIILNLNPEFLQTIPDRERTEVASD